MAQQAATDLFDLGGAECLPGLQLAIEVIVVRVHGRGDLYTPIATGFLLGALRQFGSPLLQRLAFSLQLQHSGLIRQLANFLLRISLLLKFPLRIRHLAFVVTQFQLQLFLLLLTMDRMQQPPDFIHGQRTPQLTLRSNPAVNTQRSMTEQRVSGHIILVHQRRSSRPFPRQTEIAAICCVWQLHVDIVPVDTQSGLAQT